MHSIKDFQETYFNNLILELEKEKKADQEQSMSLSQRYTFQDLAIQGLLWYPVSIISEELDARDYLVLGFKRHKNLDINSNFRNGSKIALISNREKESIEGQILHVNQQEMRVRFKCDELPHWTKLGKLGLQYIFDEYPYRLMSQNLLDLKAEKDAHNLINYLFKNIDNKSEQSFTIENKNLNEKQNLALNHALSAEHLSIIHGPPGTGKTATLVQIIKQLAKSKKILITAPSHAAVDLLTEKLGEIGLEILRIGNSGKISEKVQAFQLEEVLSKHPDQKTIKELKKRSSAFKNMAHKYKRSFGYSEREQRKALFAEAAKIDAEVENLQKYVSEQILSTKNIHLATLVGSEYYAFKNEVYDVLIIDEAAQALEPACWLPISRVKKVILAGDHFQLPPTLKFTDSKLKETLFEKLISKNKEHSTLLNTQYRSNDLIIRYSSSFFYKDELKSHKSVKDQEIKNLGETLSFIDTAGASYDEEPDGSSFKNTKEANFCLAYLQHILNDNIIESLNIGIISPYKQQVMFLSSELNTNPNFTFHKKHKVRIDSVDSFQGQEADLIFISLVRSNDKSEIGFLSDLRRMNVALTRAKYNCIVLGDSACVGQHKFYEDFIDFTQKQNLYHSVYEYPELM